MKSLSGVLTELRANWADLEVKYLHPSLYLVITDDRFSGIETPDRDIEVLSTFNGDRDAVQNLLEASNVILSVLTPNERVGEMSFLDQVSAGHHWIEFLANATATQKTHASQMQKIIHFYGYKGGQGRSTVLSMLAKAMAEDGYRVLVVDADIEAPSLPVQFDVRIDALESTLLGGVQYGLRVAPQQVFSGRGQGTIDLIACKPSGTEYNLDLAVFSLNTALNPLSLQDHFAKLLAGQSSYDLVFIDHRSGISSSVLPLVDSHPGPTVICVRLDEQSDEADEYIRVLLGMNSSNPGLFVSFSLDPEETGDRFADQSGARIEALLDILGSCIEAEGRTGDDPELTPDALREYWVSWYHDRSFLKKPSPPLSSLLSANRDALTKIRELTGLSDPKKMSPILATQGIDLRNLTNSGNTDEGLLIQTEALRKLRASNSNYRYIFGRKGTGKTRLVRALVEEGLGKTLLSAEDDSVATSISSADTLFIDLADMLFRSGAADKLWWVLLDCALKAPSQPVSECMREWLRRIELDGAASIRTSEIAELLNNLEHQVFFIDGVETAFRSAQMPAFVQGLFRFLGLIQSNATIASRLTIRLFLRTDLVQLAAENVEQQVEGRQLTLAWDTQSILNFALTRIAALQWFRDSFPSTVEKIEANGRTLAEGELPVDECSEVLLEIFPANYKRNNLRTLTFLKTYFSEGEGDAASFYPRIYDAFLRAIDKPSIIGPSAARLPQIEEGHVGQQLIVQAHDYASEQYLKQVTAELKNLVTLAEDPTENSVRVDALLPLFRGLPTPFVVTTCLDTVCQKLSNDFQIERDRVKSALDQMKRVGIFEERPGWNGYWRAGRLFKNALGMKYVRT